MVRLNILGFYCIREKTFNLPPIWILLAFIKHFFSFMLRMYPSDSSSLWVFLFCFVFLLYLSSRAVFFLMFKHHIGKHFNCEYNSENTLSPDNICPGRPCIKLANRSWKNREVFLFSERFICNSPETAQKDRYSFLKGCWFSTSQLIKVGISHWLSREICITYFRFT